SAGTIKTMIESLPALGAVRRDGRVVPVPAFHTTLDVPFADRTRRCVTIPWGDVSTAFHTTGIPNVRTFTTVPAKAIRGLKVVGPLLPLAGLRPVKRALQRWVERRVAGPDEATRARARAQLWGRVTAAGGAEGTVRAEVPEGYTLTAVAAVECAIRVLDGHVAPGAWTPARAFGAGFLATLPGTSVGEVSLDVTSSSRRSPSS
ncbi:MAG: saccharopine dehydrogenase, partial [Acidobacteriota bacterium]